MMFLTKGLFSYFKGILKVFQGLFILTHLEINSAYIIEALCTIRMILFQNS